MRTLNVSALRIELAHFAVHLGWMTPEVFHRLAVDDTRELLRRSVTSEVADVMCVIPGHESIGEEFASSDLPEPLFQHPQGARLLDCLSPRTSASPRASSAGSTAQTPRCVSGRPTRSPDGARCPTPSW